jgi:hypothetical protein
MFHAGWPISYSDKGSVGSVRKVPIQGSAADPQVLTMSLAVCLSSFIRLAVVMSWTSRTCGDVRTGCAVRTGSISIEGSVLPHQLASVFG